jgi:hypothetical protein
LNIYISIFCQWRRAHWRETQNHMISREKIVQETRIGECAGEQKMTMLLMMMVVEWNGKLDVAFKMCLWKK